ALSATARVGASRAPRACPACDARDPVRSRPRRARRPVGRARGGGDATAPRRPPALGPRDLDLLGRRPLDLRCVDCEHALLERRPQVLGVGLARELEPALEAIFESLVGRKAFSSVSFSSLRSPVTVNRWSVTSIPSSFWSKPGTSSSTTYSPPVS